jgi:hypothetical protein
LLGNERDIHELCASSRGLAIEEISSKLAACESELTVKNRLVTEDPKTFEVKGTPWEILLRKPVTTEPIR